MQSYFSPAKVHTVFQWCMYGGVLIRERYHGGCGAAQPLVSCRLCVSSHKCAGSSKPFAACLNIIAQNSICRKSDSLCTATEVKCRNQTWESASALKAIRGSIKRACLSLRATQRAAATARPSRRTPFVRAQLRAHDHDTAADARSSFLRK